jgi:hypothetical protein
VILVLYTLLYLIVVGWEVVEKLLVLDTCSPWSLDVALVVSVGFLHLENIDWMIDDVDL